MSQWFDI